MLANTSVHGYLAALQNIFRTSRQHAWPRIFGYDFDTGVRLKESYAKLGKEVGKLIAKKI